MLTYTIKGLDGCERLVGASVGPFLCILVGQVASLDVLNLRARTIGLNDLLITLVLCLHGRNKYKFSGRRDDTHL